MGRVLRRRNVETSTSESDSSVPTASANGIPPFPPRAPAGKPAAKIDKSGLYDLHQVKRLLDDEVIAFMESQGYAEAVLVSNIKIVLGTAAVIAALYSHFNGGEFPANRLLVLGCVIFYSICVWSISLASMIWEASAMYVGQLSSRAMQVSKGTLVSKVWVHTTIGTKGSSDYKIEIRAKAHKKTGNATFTRGYEHYFTEEGRLLLEKLTSDLKNTLAQVSSGSKKSQ